MYAKKCKKKVCIKTDFIGLSPFKIIQSARRRRFGYRRGL